MFTALKQLLFYYLTWSPLLTTLENTNKLLIYQVKKFKTTACILPVKTEEESTIKLSKLNRFLNLLFKTCCSLTSLVTMHSSDPKVGQSLEPIGLSPWEMLSCWCVRRPSVSDFIWAAKVKLVVRKRRAWDIIHLINSFSQSILHKRFWVTDFSRTC